ncbi:MAG TPA: glutathione S-transferase family protein [Xanthobacteraceae bacterium]|nr:glutathione S-transferase family protein [Xanthobacteraceae bacterium]
MEVILYYAPNACSLVPYVTLTEAKADFEVRTINLRREQQNAPDYLKLNPKHKVPVLVVDGRPLTENVAIQIWIARNFPQTRLLPADPWQELQAISILAWCASGLHPFLSRINSTAKVCDLPGADESVRRLAGKLLLENFRIADDMLAGRDYFFDHFTAADAHFFWCLRRGLQLAVDFSQFEHCAAHFARMRSRPSIQKLEAFEKAVQEQFAASDAAAAR